VILADARHLPIAEGVKRPVKLDVVDLFAGAGGMDEGLLGAVRGLGLELRSHVVINHWETAIETQKKNHPKAKALHTGIESVDPRIVVPGGHLHLLIAAPECTHHSTARGGRPVNDQSRSSAWLVLRWLELLTIDNVLVENVPEFRSWGPLKRMKKGGKWGMHPDPARKGETYAAFLAALRSYGYTVEERLLNAADYGEATTRTRLFIQARKGRRRVVWPEPSHSAAGVASLFRQTKRWRAAREVIDWACPSQSIFTRKKPLAPATMRRIVEGLRRFGGPELQPFVMHLTHSSDANRTRSVEQPLPTVTTANRGEMGLVEPFLVQTSERRAERVDSVETPIRTITASAGRCFGLAEPFLVPFYGERDGQEPRTHSVDAPMPVIPASGDGKFGLVEPFVVNFRGTSDKQVECSATSIDEPLKTITTMGAHHALVEPFIVGYHAERDGEAARVHGVGEPIPTLSTENRFGLVEPFILGQQSNSAPRRVDQPIPTVATAGKVALVEPFLFANRTNNVPRALDQPMPTLCTGDHIALVQPFIVTPGGADLPNGRATSDPLPTVTTSDRFALVEPFLLGQQSGSVPRPVSEPAPTVSTDGAISLVEPYLTTYYGTGTAAPVSEPVPTVTTRDRFGLVEPIVIDGRTLDIRFRMLQPHELAAAMGFPKGYQFAGNKGDAVRQIGNAVSVSTAQALCSAILSRYADHKGAASWQEEVSA
jgi:DNA (cytosine-5)-methyltransferase 1